MGGGMSKTVYTHAVVHRILAENGKPTDHLDYCVDINHAYALAHQLMATGKPNVAIIVLSEPTTIEESK